MNSIEPSSDLTNILDNFSRKQNLAEILFYAFDSSLLISAFIGDSATHISDREIIVLHS